MSNKNINTEEGLIDLSINQLRNIFTKVGLNADLIERAIGSYMKYRERELKEIELLSLEDLKNIGADNLTDYILKNLKSGGEVVDIILKEYINYLDYKTEIIQEYEKSKNWGDVFREIYYDGYNLQEAFIDCLEEFYNTTFKDAKQIVKATGIDTKGEILERLEKTLLNAKSTRYERALVTVLKEGGKYKELLEINADKYSLSKEEALRCLYETIAEYYHFMDNPGFMYTAGLRTIAEDLEAPYSVVIKANNIYSR